MITLYDFHTTFPCHGVSPYVWKIRLALNVKGLRHRTEWFQFADIDKRSKEIGIPFSEIKADGTPRYTVPAIYDSSTDTFISDSTKILEYLDKTYPETRPILPVDAAEGADFDTRNPASLRSIWPLMGPNVVAHLEGESHEVYRKRYENVLNMTVETISTNKDLREEFWERAEEKFSFLDDYFRAFAGRGPWVQRKELTVIDIVLGSDLVWILTVFGEDSEEWRRISTWNNGGWANLWVHIKPYAKVY